MSRRQFRGRVEAPRPTSAWVLVTVASATLWITEQLDPWVIALQGVAILVSLLRREAPFAWQRSGLVLNLGMFGVVGVTIAVALRGGPSTIALAHFAALGQGLQLLDARPRQTEFLLVALALFQVLLAANLTDSVLFPPLLVAFVFATVWTLLVHTLRAEALEAGDPRGVHSAITPGLLRTTLVASGVSVLVALLLFPVLPRLRSSVVTGSGVGPNLPTAGFSDHVQLGELGRIRQDSTVVLRIETLEGEAPALGAGYWRGLSFDHFDGVAWSVTPPGRVPIAGSPEAGVTLGRTPHDVDLVQRIVRDPVEAGVLFGSGETRRVQGTVRRIERDPGGGLYAVGQADERIRYTVATKRRPTGDQRLGRDRALPASRRDERYLQLPALSPAIGELASEIVADNEDDVERVRALERFLLVNGRYTNVPPQVDPADPTSPVEAFLLGDRAGHCEYFATSMVMLARSLGLPARLVNGFAGGRENAIGGFLEITRSDAHTWVEVHFVDAGWVRFDPTPPDLRARAPVALSLSERARQLASALELWWFQRVVGFDRADQIHALKQAWLAWRGAQSGAKTRSSLPAKREAPDLAGLRALAPWVLAAAGMAVLFTWRLRGRPRQGLPRSYRAALRVLARRGLRRGPATTAREFARQVEEREGSRAGAAFQTLTEAYLAERFGGRVPGLETDAALRVLRHCLRRAPAAG